MGNPQTHPGGKTKVAGRAVSRAKKSASSKVEIRHAGITAEERHRQISEAAYYRAMRRGFHGGSDLEDWLESEAEIDKLIRHD